MALTDVSLSAARTLAARYTLSGTETVMFFIAPECITVSPYLWRLKATSWSPVVSNTTPLLVGPSLAIGYEDVAAFGPGVRRGSVGGALCFGGPVVATNWWRLGPSEVAFNV
jgi:hypothetical protein